MLGLGGNLALAVYRHLGRLDQDGGVLRAEDLRTKPYRRFDLQLPERPIGGIGAAQALHQCAWPRFEVLLELAMSEQRHLADRKLARVIAAGAQQLDQRFGFRDIARIEPRTDALAGSARPEQTAHTAGRRFDFRLQRTRNFAADGGKLPAPRRIVAEVELTADPAHCVMDVFEQGDDRDVLAALEINLRSE